MADIRITDLTEQTSLTTDYCIHIANSTADKKISPANFSTSLFGGSVIGGTDAGSIVTVGGTQTLTNKTLTSPKINSTNSITATSLLLNVLNGITSNVGELNLLDGVTTTATQFNYLNTATSNIQTQLNAKLTDLSFSTRYIMQDDFVFTASGTNKTISYTDIMTDMSLASFINAWAIDTDTVNIQVWLHGSSGTRDHKNCTMSITSAENGREYRLDTIKLAGLLNLKPYTVNISMKFVTFVSPT